MAYDCSTLKDELHNQSTALGRAKKREQARTTLFRDFYPAMDVVSGADQVFTMTPDSGYQISDVLADGNSVKSELVGGKYTFVNVAAVHIFKVTFEKIQAGSGGGGGGGAATSSFTLVFDTNDGSKISSISKVSGAAADLSSYIPTREGLEFGGWYSDKELTKPITHVKLTENLTVYAKWNVASPMHFADVEPDGYYLDAVKWALQQNITHGTSATTFATSCGMWPAPSGETRNT